MRIIVMCAAGASSTFVAQRLRGAIAESGRADTAQAVPLSSMPGCLDDADVLLIGPHLAAQAEAITREAAAHGVAVAVLPADIFGDRDGHRALQAAADAGAGAGGPIEPVRIPLTHDERNER
jgi:PTS system cellobiose-specific IIB component